MAKAEGKKRIVVKVGTSTLTHKTGKTNIACKTCVGAF